ncbi:hypothetical protein LB579_31830 [Mesorhizobium sp. BR1-1-7]|uniref:hypothetical protein n=1 Tax=Mesorhizobium sp. BR1-1-7 TaxID=2876647 RepID=UPI001CCFFEA9|nr:hypothetical protein [Mesorhizobium sp. BR1-1-7]MBZ9922268.1 hypothetical protein [Mesorhizobium sp. BR1-1-7]
MYGPRCPARNIPAKFIYEALWMVSPFSPDWRNELLRNVPLLNAANTFSGNLTIDGTSAQLILGKIAGSSALPVPALVLAKRTSAASETIGVSDGAGGYSALVAYLGSSEWTFRIGDTVTDDFKISSNGISQFGGQLVFPATQNPSAGANTLDDYEENSWTPTITFGGSSTGISYGTRAGRYVKIGQMVWAFFDFTLTSKGSATGGVNVTSFPFTSLNDGMLGVVSIAFYSGMTGLTGGLRGYLNINLATANLVQDGAATTANITDANFTNTSRIVGVAMYRAA